MEFGGVRKRGRNGVLSIWYRKQIEALHEVFQHLGCPFGEGCHFLHYVPGGIKAVSQMTGGVRGPAMPPPARNAVPPSFPDGSSPPAVKTRICQAGWGGTYGATTTWSWRRCSFGASATAKISVDASLAGAIIGKSGVNSKQICRLTGAKLSIREHDSDSNLRNIELEGTFDQIKQATAVVRELIVNVSSAAGPPSKNAGAHGPPLSNYKTKLCENFAKGSCTFGERCHFAHGTEDLRKPITQVPNRSPANE
ncbi:K Homology domain, type 1, partial [Dillenia turbinata]